jgi:glycosyltransferase involved in cell wall biosynthesis
LAEKAGVKVNTIDLSARPGPATLARRLSRLPKVFVGIPKFLTMLARRRADVVYVGVSGGSGQLYEILFASLATFSGRPLYLHHDSYSYLGRRKELTAILIRMAGPSATHIVLCEDMKKRLTEFYGRDLQVVVVSNMTNIESPLHQPRARTRLKTIGFISYLSRSKGVLEFFDVAERVRSFHPDLIAKLAGPIEELSLTPVIEERLRKAPWISYLGPIYGAIKSQFYADIDALVFPTQYENEADPRVINEALAHGVVVVSWGRGCIGSVIAGGGGVAIRPDHDFIDEAQRLLQSWYADPDLFSSLSSAALANSARLEADNRVRLDALISRLVTASA